MTFLPNVTGIVSADNSSTTPLASDAVFTGLPTLAREYSTISVTTFSNQPGRLTVEFSPDAANWDIRRAYSYSPSNLNYSKQLLIEGEYIRVVFENGPLAQTEFRLQTRLHVANTARNSEQLVDCATRMKDAFGRLRTSVPFTLLDITHSQGVNNIQETESVVGGASSSHHTDAGVTLDVFSSGDHITRQSRARAIPPPGKSVLVLITGMLNGGDNPGTSTSRIGYYDNSNGFYVEYSSQQVFVGFRSSVTGSPVDTKVAQEFWNGSSNITIDMSVVHVFFFDFQWLGVGLVKVGVIVNGKPQLLHVFRTTSIQYASLPTRYELESSGGAASSKFFASTVISEGGYVKPGIQQSAHSGVSPRSMVKNVRTPVFTCKLKAGSMANVRINVINVLRVGKYDGLWEIFIFRDPASVLTSPNFVSASDHVECDFEASGVDTTSGVLLASGYYSGNSTDSTKIDDDEVNAMIANNISDVSDLLVMTYTAISGSDDIYVSASWKEYL